MNNYEQMEHERLTLTAKRMFPIACRCKGDNGQLALFYIANAMYCLLDKPFTNGELHQSESHLMRARNHIINATRTKNLTYYVNRPNARELKPVKYRQSIYIAN